jgi:membrane-associated phospholipid phosphatase
MLAWSFAHVVSDEYPHWWVRLLAYSTATTASVSRIVGRKHFPGDVVVGSALGYLVGGYVFHHHRAQE